VKQDRRTEKQTRSLTDFRSPFSLLRDSLLALVYPQACAICRRSVETKHDGIACGRCWRKTRIFKDEEILCRKCGAFLKTGEPVREVFCRRCDEDIYDEARAVGLYENALSTSVLVLKKQPYLSPRLQNLLISTFENSPFQDATRIIPVPLSRKRLSERGFNQAAVIARAISKQTGVAVDESSLVRKVHTEKHRAGMDRKARAESVKNVFGVKRPRLVSGENILLVDDVFTSGATASNCAEALKKSGARRVYVLTIARAF
jgi:ComF family protein